MREEILLWRRVDEPGHESARLVYHEPFWQMGGMAVFAAEGKVCRLEYSIACDAAWRTLHVDVAGWVGARRIRFHLVANAQRVWQLDGRPSPRFGTSWRVASRAREHDRGVLPGTRARC